jgi:hypothetical protein
MRKCLILAAAARKWSSGASRRLTRNGASASRSSAAGSDQDGKREKRRRRGAHPTGAPADKPRSSSVFDGTFAAGQSSRAEVIGVKLAAGRAGQRPREPLHGLICDDNTRSACDDAAKLTGPAKSSPPPKSSARPGAADPQAPRAHSPRACSSDNCGSDLHFCRQAGNSCTTTMLVIGHHPPGLTWARA